MLSIGCFVTHELAVRSATGRFILQRDVYVSKPTTICSDDGLVLGQHQAILLKNDGILLIGTIATNFSEILSSINTFSFKKMH